MFDKKQIANSTPEVQEIIVESLVGAAAPNRLEEIKSRATRMVEELKDRLDSAETDEDKAVEIMVISLLGVKLRAVLSE